MKINTNSFHYGMEHPCEGDGMKEQLGAKSAEDGYIRIERHMAGLQTEVQLVSFS